MDKYILLVAATSMEIQPTLDFLAEHEFKVRGNEIAVLITGIGSIQTTYLLTYNLNAHLPDYILQAGIAGSFSEEYPPGSLVFVQEEVNGDMGVEEDNVFKDLFDMGLQDASAEPYSGKTLLNPFGEHWEEYRLQFVRSVTVNEITTRTSRIEQLKQKYQPDVESMEGAAFHYVCLMESVPFIQLRAVSNYVGERDKSKWKMAEAINMLNEQLIEIFNNEW